MKNLLLFGLAATFLPASTVFAQPGSPDPAFGGGDGFTTTSFLSGGHAVANAVAVRPDGRIVAVGESWTPGAAQSGVIALARYLPNGDLDPTFGDNGKITAAFPNLSLSANDLSLLPNGKILVCGGAWSDSEEYFLLGRFNADGAPDTGFDGDGIVLTKVGIASEYGDKMAMQADGKIVVAGYANLGGYAGFAVVRYHPNGALDDSFGDGDGIVTVPVGESYSGAKEVAIQPDGKIVAAGYAVANGYEDFAAIRFYANGAVDPSFSADGKLIVSLSDKNDRAGGLVLQPDGKVLMAGQAGHASDDSKFGVVRLNANGTPDNGFGDGGTVLFNINNQFESASAMVVHSDGKILIGGCSQQNTTGTYIYDFTLVRLTANGQPDHTFGNNGIATLATSPSSDFIYDLALQSDGKIIAAGRAQTGDFGTFSVARLITGASVATVEEGQNNFHLRVFPNPVGGDSILEYELAQPETISIQLYDAGGRLIKILAPGLDQTAGQYRIPLGASDWPGGVYFLHMESRETNASIKITKQF